MGMAYRTMSLKNTLSGSKLTFEEVAALYVGNFVDLSIYLDDIIGYNLNTQSVTKWLIIAMQTPLEVQPRI